jgi:hypothetical protein
MVKDIINIFTHAEKVGNPGKNNQTESHEIEPNPLKDRAMYEGDNPFF